MHYQTRRRFPVMGLLALCACGTGCWSSAELAERTALLESGLLKENEDGDFARLYSYYPDAQVYHNAWQDKYYYEQDGKWVATVHLPEDIELTEGYVVVELYTDKPYDEHEMVLALHPAGETSGEAWATAPTE